ncbi:MAG TPA: hypothetical protein ACFYD4_16720 [Candidatus Wunengus sp. YC61]|uniref:hypothetical protein n=1 Tax=Candidatus Wunengus sp. YC61 TaxID=3367698 RepID=UPI004028996B
MSNEAGLLLCSCGNKSVGTSNKGEPFCLDCVKGATVKEIMARMPVIKDKKIIEWLKGLGILRHDQPARRARLD